MVSLPPRTRPFRSSHLICGRVQSGQLHSNDHVHPSLDGQSLASAGLSNDAAAAVETDAKGSGLTAGAIIPETASAAATTPWANGRNIGFIDPTPLVRDTGGVPGSAVIVTRANCHGLLCRCQNLSPEIS